MCILYVHLIRRASIFLKLCFMRLQFISFRLYRLVLFRLLRFLVLWQVAIKPYEAAISLAAPTVDTNRLLPSPSSLNSWDREAAYFQIDDPSIWYIGGEWGAAANVRHLEREVHGPPADSSEGGKGRNAVEDVDDVKEDCPSHATCFAEIVVEISFSYPQDVRSQRQSKTFLRYCYKHFLVSQQEEISWFGSSGRLQKKPYHPLLNVTRNTSRVPMKTYVILVKGYGSIAHFAHSCCPPIGHGAQAETSWWNQWAWLNKCIS